MRPVSIGGFDLTHDGVMFVAEIGGNHGGSEELAARMLLAASAAGAHAVKFQVYDTNRFLAGNSPYFEEFDRERLPYAAFSRLAKLAREAGVVFLATPFDPDSAAFLSEIGVPAFKIASCDIDNFMLLDAVAGHTKPIILSTGASSLDDIDNAVGFIRERGVEDIVLLQCTAAYPADPAQANLRVIPMLAERYGVPVGLSDHTAGAAVPIAASVLGACLVEKHFTTDRALPGGDNEMSVLADEWSQMMRDCRLVRSTLGDGRKGPTPGELELRPLIRRSLFARRGIKAGQTIGPGDLDAKRPGDGVPASKYPELLGKTARTGVDAGEPLPAGIADPVV